MTNEMAIDRLKHLFFSGKVFDDTSEALDFAIKALETHEEHTSANNDSEKTHECDCRCHLTDRPCSVCEYNTDNGCSKWSCVFEEDNKNEK